ncbi:hypothetical protein M8044_000311 [Columbia Basin potato purple top phytoplasma]|uniref:Uncharacterized protein n=1 Tax=Columbia Basin potato purple top phytoplasma TaxID=307134 RepID=A0ABT5L915_9MOLU|nr:hypothetical protein [Columbia Basin potato purple top phytoplasma]
MKDSIFLTLTYNPGSYNSIISLNDFNLKLILSSIKSFESSKFIKIILLFF